MTNNESKIKRVLYLDLVRIMACLMVIIMHSPMDGASSYVQNVCYFLTSPCVCLFFMVSGALLLPTQDVGWIFVKKRFKKVLFPTLFWTLFYMIANVIWKYVDLRQIPQQLLSIPFCTQGHGILWFMYTLFGLYLLAPIISPWLRNAQKRDVQLLLFLWSVTLCFPMLKLFLMVNEENTSTFYYFSGYAGYFLLGYYIHQFKPSFKYVELLLMIIVPISLMVFAKFMHLEGNYIGDVFWYLSIFVAMMCVFWFICLRRISQYISENSKTSHYISLFSKLSFGIYLIHIFVIRYCLLNFMEGGIIQISITVIITLFISFAVSLLISKLPFGKYIIGYQKHKGVKNDCKEAKDT